MTGFNAVTRIGFLSASDSMRSRFTVNPATALSAKSLAALPRIVMDWRRLWAITGNITFSSKFPCWFAMVIAASFPVTWADTIIIISHITGFTLPGMMLEPGWSAGRAISPRPAIGPLFIQRRSFAIFKNDDDVVLS